MPLYEYQCTRCGTRFERLQKLSDPAVTECPVCGGPVEKLVSSPAFQFKGTGWYVTDYARKAEGAAGSSEAKTKETSAKDAPAADSTKPADKPSEKPSGDSKVAGESPTSKPGPPKSSV